MGAGAGAFIPMPAALLTPISAAHFAYLNMLVYVDSITPGDCV